MTKYPILTAEQEKQLTERYPTTENKTLAVELGTSFNHIQFLAKKRRLIKAPGYMAQLSIDRAAAKKKPIKTAYDRTGTPAYPGQKTLKHPKQERQTLTDYLRPLPYSHPDKQAWLRHTKPGSPAGSAPRTLTELRARA